MTNEDMKTYSKSQDAAYIGKVDKYEFVTATYQVTFSWVELPSNNRRLLKPPQHQ
jgi:hypothetical protein